MFFDSIEFAIFIPIVFLLYWLLGNYKLSFQNILLLVSSYFFYSCWDIRFVSLLIFSTSLDYFFALKIEQSNNNKFKIQLLAISIAINLGVLAYFKYCNFFIDSFINLFNSFGLNISSYTLNIVLPIGISFYTFHGLSYIIDVYKNKIKAESSFINYALFVSFFPLLVAGPIERATHLLPQIKQKRVFNLQFMPDAFRQILWGLFKKIVIADNCAEYVNVIFDNSTDFSGSTLLLGAFLFTVQIYCDFSGYSDIAIGVAKLLGIDLIRNFSFPYFSRNMSEFWRRWHISLSSWFKDYVYIPLGGSKVSKSKQILNTFIVFAISGFWHGAEWKYIFWGVLNAIFVVPSILIRTTKVNLEIVAKGKFLPTLKDFCAIVLTFLLTIFMWIFFRSQNFETAIQYILGIFSETIISYPNFTGVEKVHQILLLIAVFFTIEWLGRENQFAIEKLELKFPQTIRWIFYYSIIFLICLFSGNGEQFIYFQF